jgi:hypothetical protein
LVVASEKVTKTHFFPRRRCIRKSASERERGYRETEGEKRERGEAFITGGDV